MVSAPRCSDSPCPVHAVALARLEILFYEVTVKDIEEICWLRQAGDRFSISEATRMAYLEGAKQLEAGLISRAVGEQRLGRPKRRLAQAVAHQLWAGGFSQSQTADLMGSTVATARQRCKARDSRSLPVFFDPMRSGGSSVQPA